MLKKGTNNLNVGLKCACCGGNIEIVEFLIKKGANDLNHGLLCACMCEDLYIYSLRRKNMSTIIDIIKLMLEKGANNLNEVLNMARCHNLNNIISILEDYITKTKLSY